MKHLFTMTSPAKKVPSRAFSDGAVTGNGDLSLVWSGTADRVRLYLGKCDFWKADGNAYHPVWGGVAPVGYADVLPALPDAWKTGSVKGLKARGNFTFDFAWRDGLLTSLSVQSAGAKTLRLRLPAGQRPESDVALEREGDRFVYSFPEAGTLTLRFSQI